MDLHSVLFAPGSDSVDFLVAELYACGTAGIIEEGACIRAFFEDDVDYGGLLAAFPPLEMRRESTLAAASVNSDCEAVYAGERFFIVSAASAETTPEGRYRLVMNDASAFGTGRHETTQLMLGALEQLMATAHQTVLDIGTGTGILAAAARLLGAKSVWCCDIYEDGVRSAYRHFGLPAFVGSADAARDGLAQITLANITPRILDAIAYDLKRVTASAGCILISGFLRGGEPARFRPETVWERGDWLCWLCPPENIDAQQNERRPVIHAQEWW